MATSWEKSPILTGLRAYVDDLYDGNIRAAARSLGVQYATFFMWYKGKRAPRMSTIVDIMDALKAAGKIKETLIYSEGDPEGDSEDYSDVLPSPSKAEKLKVLEDFEFIPRAVAIAGCGESLQTEDGLQSLYAFRKEFLRREGIQAKDALMMYVSGDSMQPTIMDKDTILIDKRDNVPKDGHIYVLSLGDTLMVKRLQRIADGWLLRSDNPKYAPVTVQGQEQEKMVVHGRVRWYSRVI